MSENLTVVILTKNEEENLPRCLAAIPEAYEVVVVDSGSSDRTRDIAQAHGCTVVENEWAGFAAQRNFALRACGIASKWVLFIDADEVYPWEFFDWFEATLAPVDSIDAVLVPSILVFKGKKLRFAPGYPIYHPRLVRSGQVTFCKNHTGHGESIPDNLRVIYAEVPYYHYFYNGDATTWMVKHVNNAGQEYQMRRTKGAKLTNRAKLSAMLGGSVLRIPLRFAYHYFIRQGIRDGREGLEYALLYTWYEATKYVIGRSKR